MADEAAAARQRTCSTLSQMDRIQHADFGIGQLATAACILEVTAPKVGNVHRGADFPDLTLNDFLLSAVAIGPAMDSAGDRGVGATVLSAIQATRAAVQTNTNLGMVLLSAPLAAVPLDRPLASGVAQVLEAMDRSDAEAVYQAIRIARPGGLGSSPEMDVNIQVPERLLDAMELAAGRDLVAQQYVDNFSTVFQEVVPRMREMLKRGWNVSDVVVRSHLQVMADHPDSLIARKCGLEMATEAAARAKEVLESGEPSTEAYLQALTDFDFWLRSDHNRRNPGTSADIVAAALFALLREGHLRLPL